MALLIRLAHYGPADEMKRIETLILQQLVDRTILALAMFECKEALV